ncbi:methyltransferase domain-containing protein [Brevundimonas lutea]|uniref:methyltransferase domain-containing protein n=1 Tax=Brevundimonas lutea TaxID=2293980 RepID=UPI000F012B67|nr:methyltransferase domain-containing protein [Brevundimonas lutea]
MRRDFSVRSGEAELMDGLDTAYEVFRDCLADLGRVNRLTLAHRPTLAYLETLRGIGAFDLDRPVEILDIGSGGGDLLRRISGWAARRGVPVALTGLDLSPWSARAASEAWRGGPEPRWVTGDVFDHPCAADVIVTSLVTHHLTGTEIVRLLARMDAEARVGWFVNDLHRHPLAFHGFRVLAAVMRWHPFVRHDGPVSIARAFTVDDWRRYRSLARLDPHEARIARRFPFRICVSREPK